MLNAALPHNNNGTAMSLEGGKKKYTVGADVHCDGIHNSRLHTETDESQ